ncbi:MAG: hypothetical protein IJI07_03435 [Flexilinea sp.]|nr:hypothetical protein [Flexilinea sp.]
MSIFSRFKKKNVSPVVEMIRDNLNRFGIKVDDYGTRADFLNGEVYNYICTKNTTIKMVPNSSGTAFTTMIDTSMNCRNNHELESRIEEFIKAYIAVLFIHTVLTLEDIERIKSGEPYNKNGIRSVMDRKEDSLYVTIFDSNNRRTDNLFQNND